MVCLPALRYPWHHTDAHCPCMNCVCLPHSTKPLLSERHGSGPRRPLGREGLVSLALRTLPRQPSCVRLWPITALLGRGVPRPRRGVRDSHREEEI